MNFNEFTDFYSHLDEQEQSRFLSHLAYELTIAARDAYAPENDSITDPARLKAVNELIHVLIGQQVKLLTQETKRYPDSVFSKTLYAGIEHENMRYTLERAVRFCSPPATVA